MDTINNFKGKSETRMLDTFTDACFGACSLTEVPSYGRIDN